MIWEALPRRVLTSEGFVDQGLSQLQMMLIKQAGPASLALTNLLPDEFLRFVRRIEQLICEQSLSPVIAYSSSQVADRLLPEAETYAKLRHDALCAATFSEDRKQTSGEWCFLVESAELCLIVTAQESYNPESQGRMQCVGSLDPQVVKQSFQKMLPLWQAIDFEESNRIEDARAGLAACGTDKGLAEYLRKEWPVIRLTSAETKIFQSQGVVDPITGLARPQMKPSALAQSDLVLPVIRSDLKAAFAKFIPPEPVQAPPEEIVLAPEEKPCDLIQISVSRHFKNRKGMSLNSLIHRHPTAIPPQAQSIIYEIVAQLRQSDDLSAILQLAIERLTSAGKSDRGLIWQIVGDKQLAVTNEFSVSGHTPFVGNRLGNQESAAIVMDFLSLFPDESGAGVISIPDTHKDSKLHKLSPTLSSLLELGDVGARLVVQLRSQGEMLGFLELQQCQATRQWSEEDAGVIQSVAEMLSVVVAQADHQAKIESDAQEKKLINDIASLFRESSGKKGKDTLSKSVRLVCEHMGFEHAQIYLYSKEEARLVPQIAKVPELAGDFGAKDNHFVSVFDSGRGKIINTQYSRKGDPVFGKDSALVVPLVAEGERLGALGLWKRAANRPELTEQDRNLALAIGGQLASFIRADQAIAQIREDQAREALINRVFTEIRQSWKDVDRIVGTLVESLQEYFGLALSVVSLWDAQAQDFTKSKTIAKESLKDPLAPNLGEQLFLVSAEELKAGTSILLTRDQILERLSAKDVAVPGSIQSALLVPMVHGDSLRAALCLASQKISRPFDEKDMKMIEYLAERVAGEIAYAYLFAEKEQQAITDPMTGLFNRRHFQEQMSKEIDRSKRYNKSFTYCIVDLDFLKKINDKLGHQFGDAAIKHIAVVLKNTLREIDTAARYGGEEFVIIFPETDVKTGRAAAERVCAAIREKPVEGVGIITASVGVATYPIDAQDRDTVTELADQALYLAKHRGRNRVCSAADDLIPSLQERGEEALEVQKATIKAKAEEMASIDLKLIAEHGILGILGAIVKIIEARDAYSNERSPRAAEYATRLAQMLRLSKDHIAIISLAAILHNVGKIALPEELLQKKGPLTAEERKVIEQSPVIGAKILEPAKHLFNVAAVIETYHEHWDGSGYPKGMKGEEIPLESRVVALVDAYIAMTSDRPYRAALSKKEAIAIIKEESGKKWDPRLVKLFLSILDKESAAVGQAANPA